MTANELRYQIAEIRKKEGWRAATLFRGEKTPIGKAIVRDRAIFRDGFKKGAPVNVCLKRIYQRYPELRRLLHGVRDETSTLPLAQLLRINKLDIGDPLPPILELGTRTHEDIENALHLVPDPDRDAHLLLAKALIRYFGDIVISKESPWAYSRAFLDDIDYIGKWGNPYIRVYYE